MHERAFKLWSQGFELQLQLYIAIFHIVKNCGQIQFWRFQKLWRCGYNCGYRLQFKTMFEVPIFVFSHSFVLYFIYIFYFSHLFSAHTRIYIYIIFSLFFFFLSPLTSQWNRGDLNLCLKQSQNIPKPRKVHVLSSFVSVKASGLIWHVGANGWRIQREWPITPVGAIPSWESWSTNLFAKHDIKTRPIWNKHISYYSVVWRERGRESERPFCNF